MSQNESDPFRRFASSNKKRLKLNKVYSKKQILSKLEFPGSELKIKKASSFSETFYENKFKMKKEVEDDSNFQENFLSNPIQNLTQDVIKDQKNLIKEINIAKQIIVKENHNKSTQIIQEKENIIKEISNIYNLLTTNIEKNEKISKITQNYNEDTSILNSTTDNFLQKSLEVKTDLEQKDYNIKLELDKLETISLQKLESMQILKNEIEDKEFTIKNLKRDINLLEDYINNELNVKYEEVQSTNKILEEKRLKNYNTKMDYLFKTFILKPYYRKFLIIRSGENHLKYKFKICKKSRRTFTIMNTNNIELKVNFDYIFSSFDSLYDYLDPLIEDEKINCDLLKIFANYIGDSPQHNMLFLYLTQLKEKVIFDSKIVTILTNLITQYSNDYLYSIKLIARDELIELVSDEVYIEENNFFKNSRKKNFKKELKLEIILGFTFTMISVKNKSKITFIVTDYNNYSLINLILGKFNEENNPQTKRKRDKSYTKKKIKKDYQFFFEEIKQDNTLYYCSLVEIDAEKVNLQDESLNDIFLSL